MCLLNTLGKFTMLYYLYEYFGINIFKYITLRAGIAFFISLGLSMFLIPLLISWANKKNYSQPILKFTPDNHQNKKNTPTMGGLILIISTIIATIITAKIENLYVIGAIITLILFTAIGLKDDLAKIADKNNKSGLSVKAKFSLQIMASIFITLFLYKICQLDTDFYLPFYKYPIQDLNIFSIIFWSFIIVATSNAVNITDGLDGLASVPSMASLISLAIFAYIIGHKGISSYLFLKHISSVGEVSIISASLIGSLVGFLWYNAHPAQIFMGDTGSLSIGAFIAYLSIITKNEILLILIGFIFFVEALSVILQVFSYKMRKKRIFLMSPIHHHFELKKLHENKITIRFWIIAILTNIIALISLKIR